MSDILVLPSMDLTPAFTRTQGQQEDSLEGQREVSLRGSNGAFVSWCKTRGRFQEGMPLRPLGLSLETIQETSEIFMFADINRVA